MELTVPDNTCRRSSAPKFSCKEQCVFCGDLFNLDNDPKHPCHWYRVVLCRIAYRG